MINDLDINGMQCADLSSGSHDMKQSQLANEAYEVMETVFNLIFSSSLEVLGEISSIGVRFGGALDKPDHMLVLFSDEVVVFQSWNDVVLSCRWRYHRAEKKLLRNGVVVDQSYLSDFISVIQQGLRAIQNQEVSFSKNITQKEIEEFQ